MRKNSVKNTRINTEVQKELAEIIAKALDSKKGIDVTMIDIAEKSSFADYFVLASAGSERQAKALQDAVEEPEESNDRSFMDRVTNGWNALNSKLKAIF